MAAITLEGVVDHGQIRLAPNIQLPEKTRGLVVVPDAPPLSTLHIFSPHLLHPEQAKDFQLKIITESTDVGL